MMEYQQKLWDLFLNKGMVVEGDEQSFLRNYPTNFIARQFYDMWKPKPSRSRTLDEYNNDAGSVETSMRKHRKSKPKSKRCYCRKK
jgi:hypothetical protein